MQTLKPSLALNLIFAEANSLVVLDFPQHTLGYLQFKKLMGVEILVVTFPGLFKPSILNADAIHFTWVGTPSCTFSEPVKLSTYKLDSHFKSKAQPLKIISGFLFQELPITNPISSIFFNFCSLWIFKPNLKYFPSTSMQRCFHPRSQTFLTTKVKPEAHMYRV